MFGNYRISIFVLMRFRKYLFVDDVLVYYINGVKWYFYLKFIRYSIN